MKRKVVVLGASENPLRYSNIAVRSLYTHGYEVIAIGSKEGVIGDVRVRLGKVDTQDVYAITLYLSQINQLNYYEYILSIKPEKLIFNPGSENTELQNLAVNEGIEVINDCTLLMLVNKRF